MADSAQVDVRRQLIGLTLGYQISAAIGAVAGLGIPDRLAGGPRSTEALAEEAGVDVSALERLLRCMVAIGVLERVAGRYGLTEMGQLLRADHPGSLRSGAMLYVEDWMWRPFAHVADAVRTGRTGFAVAHGIGLWQYLDDNPEAGGVFNQHMARSAARMAAALTGTYDFANVECLVDVGGGHGALVCSVLKANPTMRAVVFDRPSVMAGAAKQLAQAGLADRCDLVGGDFFEAVPPGGDAYVLSWIVHDWSDSDAVRILGNVRTAVSDRGRLLLIEEVLPPDGVADFVHTSELAMLVIAGGRERTEAEFRQLYESAGFELTRVLPIQSSPRSIIEGRPI
ncbi:MAG TPA: methyltransferase [Acidimicrobiales bacterium]|nr:methyltransferase [Acidimicrobiales bacterium]